MAHVRPALLLALAALLVGAPSAQAGFLSKTGSEITFQVADKDFTDNRVAVSYCAADGCITVETFDYYVIADGERTIDPGNSGCTPWGPVPGSLQCPASGITAWRVLPGAGDDEVAVNEVAADFPASFTADGGSGGDELTSSLGEESPVSFRGGAGADTLKGGWADDLLDGGPGADVFTDVDGVDTVTYAGRSLGVNVALGTAGADDGSSEDGPEGARDNIGAGIENVTGGDGADRLDGGPGANVLDGGPGGDFLNGLAGVDTVRGGAGADSIEGRDGVVDFIDCGPDIDVTALDPPDWTAHCEPPATADGGGSGGGGSGGGGEGGGTTIIRETVTLPSRVIFDLAYTFTAARRGTVLRNLGAETEPGSRLTASCRTSRGRRCRRTRDFSRGSAAVSTRLRGFEGKRLPVGARLTIRVTKPDAIGVVKTLTIRRRKAPSVRTLCLPPGASRPAAC